MEEQINLYVDGAGRYILGVELSNTNDVIRIKNPALIVINTGANGQIQIQTIPFFFKELLAPTCDKCVWDFPKNCAKAVQIELSEQLIRQYYNAISPVPQTQVSQQQSNQPKVVKLFDE